MGSLKGQWGNSCAESVLAGQTIPGISTNKLFLLNYYYHQHKSWRSEGRWFAWWLQAASESGCRWSPEISGFMGRYRWLPDKPPLL